MDERRIGAGEIFDTIQIAFESLDGILIVLEVIEDILLSSKECHVIVIAPKFDQRSLEETGECKKRLKGTLEGTCT